MPITSAPPPPSPPPSAASLGPRFSLQTSVSLSRCSLPPSDNLCSIRPLRRQAFLLCDQAFHRCQAFSLRLLRPASVLFRVLRPAANPSSSAANPSSNRLLPPPIKEQTNPNPQNHSKSRACDLLLGLLWLGKSLSDPSLDLTTEEQREHFWCTTLQGVLGICVLMDDDYGESYIDLEDDKEFSFSDTDSIDDCGNAEHKNVDVHSEEHEGADDQNENEPTKALFCSLPLLL
ncbi:hypothetical protein RIF29_29599 [Crotalaria pallida]|uniref:Uncharacterized protein n=1 Tax=Crotalaria pallida TaxID=3830 RepID=A0AAN9HW16_CROPI